MRVKSEDVIKAIQGGLVVSCQALEGEPLHSSFIMGRMALAASQGGAVAIRSNSVSDITEIKKNVDLPIIGIIKVDYEDSEVYITPTMKEVDELMQAGPDIIALDATDRIRPHGQTLTELFAAIKEKYPEQLLMADCSTIEEALYADKLGFDFIGTTMVGYTKASEGDKIDADDFYILREIISRASHKVICEGNIDTPEKAAHVLELGAHCVVVGGAITRPQLITQKFTNKINEFKKESL